VFCSTSVALWPCNEYLLGSIDWRAGLTSSIRIEVPKREGLPADFESRSDQEALNILQQRAEMRVHPVLASGGNE
jgi:hypothetical protein